jgi:hypothetical protein
MTHKADVTIEFTGRSHRSFAFAGAVVEALLDFSGDEKRIVEVFNLTGTRSGVSFELFGRKTVQDLNRDIQLLVGYLQKECSVHEFRANVWSSNDNFDASYDDGDEWIVASNLN